MKRIQTLIALLIVIFLFTGVGKSQKLLTEDFNYAAGQLLTANGWNAVSGAGTNAITVSATGGAAGLSYSGYAGDNIGLSVTLAASGENDSKLLSAPVKSGSMYVAAMIKVTSAGSGDYFFIAGNGTSTFYNRLYVKAAAGGFNFGIAKYTETANYESTVRTIGTIYLVVIKYSYGAVTNVYVNPILASEPGTPTLASTGTSDIGSSGITAVYLRQGGPVLTVDGIRAGITWADVTTPPCVLSLTALIQARYNGSAMVPDTVTVELHDSSSYALVDQDKELLSASGTGTFSFSSAVNGSSYYIVVKHRNSIETWSAAVQSFSSYTLSYDFTTAAAKAYGNNLVLQGGKYCIYSGDVNQDGYVTESDFTSVYNDNSLGGAPPNNYHLQNDLNGDGRITGDDLSCIDNNSANGVSKKVPSGLTLTSDLGSFSQTSTTTPSAEQTYTISGAGLTANVTVVPPAGFEISKSTGSGFVNSTGSLVFTSADVIAGKTIYVRMNAGALGSFSGNITHTSGNSEFTTADISVTGECSSGNVNLTMGNPSGATTDQNNPNNYLLVKPQFCESYSRDKGSPNWVSWQLNSTWCNGTVTRSGSFHTDASLPASFYHVTDNDYNNSGFSRGHMCPSADRTCSLADNDSVFEMTNMVPQNQNNNAGAWEGLENYERTLAIAGNVVYIISGGYGAGGTTTDDTQTLNTIASGKVTVPAELWKVMIVVPNGSGSDVSRVTTSTRTIAIIIPNDSSPNSMSAWGNYRVSVDSVEALTGFDFFSNVDPAIQAVIEAKVDNGPTQ